MCLDAARFAAAMGFEAASVYNRLFACASCHTAARCNPSSPTGSMTRPQQRWVPYRHSNGLAIYQHHSKTRGEPPEYMVSSTVLLCSSSQHTV